MPAEAQDDDALRQGQAVEALAGKQPEIERSVPPADAPESVPRPLVTRDPFWPVGYVPPPEEKVDDSTTAPKSVADESQMEPLQWDAAIKALIIKGIMKSSAGYLAVINGQVMSENDTISAVFKGRTYSWRVVKINRKGVQFERLEPAQ
jgi:hypothetical protein